MLPAFGCAIAGNFFIVKQQGFEWFLFCGKYFCRSFKRQVKISEYYLGLTYLSAGDSIFLVRAGNVTSNVSRSNNSKDKSTILKEEIQ